MRLERLRQIREILRRLDKAIREEDREQKLSAQTTAREAKAAELAAAKAKLEELIPPSDGPFGSQPRWPRIRRRPEQGGLV